MPVINRDKEPEEVSPAGLRADGMGEAVSVVRTGPSRPSIDHCGGRQGALGDSLTGRAWTAQRMAGLLAQDGWSYSEHAELSFGLSSKRSHLIKRAQEPETSALCMLLSMTSSLGVAPPAQMSHTALITITHPSSLSLYL